MEEKPKVTDNTVFIGRKETMAYVFAITTQAQLYNEIFIKARGRSISKAVDVSQISINRFLNSWEIGTVNLSTDEVPEEVREQGYEHNKQLNERISCINIQMFQA